MKITITKKATSRTKRNDHYAQWKAHDDGSNPDFEVVVKELSKVFECEPNELRSPTTLSAYLTAFGKCLRDGVAGVVEKKAVKQ